jgi:membrane peptidoglycan carboxypeptidase
LKQGGFRLGASTISMQTVKNLLLGSEKTLARKLQELFLTWYLEQNLTKERLLEIYLNVIEFGPSIYGIGAAARHYFGKSANELTPLEAAFFATILPSPKRRYIQYCHGELTPSWDRYVRRVLKRMVEKGFVDEKAFADAEKQKIIFARDLQTLSEAVCLQQLKELLDAWDAEQTRRLKDAILQAAPHQLEMYLGALAK